MIVSLTSYSASLHLQKEILRQRTCSFDPKILTHQTYAFFIYIFLNQKVTKERRKKEKEKMEYKHFSHQHPLTLYKVQQGHQFQCHGCNLPCHDSIFACWNCSFFLHEHCGNANRYVKHPCHPPHPLALMAVPTYCSGSFLCNGCGAPGSTFSYSCPLCEVDLHVPCAYLPHKVSHESHEHEIFLSLGRKEQNGSPEYCKICSKELSYKHWSYFCDKPECDFRVHTFCATSEVKPGQYLDDEPDDGPCNSSSAEEVLAEMFQIQMQLQMAQQLFLV